jgi:TPR repeat protein
MVGKFNLGNFYLTGTSVPQDSTKDFYWFKKSAEQGNQFVQLNLGSLHSSGNGIQQNTTQALYWLQKSAEQNNVKAQVNLGGLYLYGSNGVVKDLNKPKYG